MLTRHAASSARNSEVASVPSLLLSVFTTFFPAPCAFDLVAVEDVAFEEKEEEDGSRASSLDLDSTHSSSVSWPSVRHGKVAYIGHANLNRETRYGSKPRASIVGDDRRTSVR